MRRTIRTGLSDGIHLEVLEGVTPETELTGVKVEPEGASITMN